MIILLVEDNQSILKSISKFLSDLGHEVVEQSNGKDALRYMQNNPIHLVFSDIRMPFMDGAELLKQIKKSDKLKNIEVVLFTGHGDVKGAVEAMRDGAYDYLLKPIDINELEVIVNRINKYLTLKYENLSLTNNFKEKVKEATEEVKKELVDTRKALAYEVGTAEIGIYSDSMRNLFNTAKKLHQNPDLAVLIEGETGTGKELLARYIHYEKGDVITPFIGLNCAAISSNLFESELFGYEAGAFTGGRIKGQKGKLELAEDGTLFLDEITEMSTEHQAKLLRVIQEREYFRVGGLKQYKTNARFICTTNRNIKEMIKKGTFREDLFFRLSVGYMRIPSLRERREEIIPLAQLFLDKIAHQKPTRFSKINKEAKSLLEKYAWPGNVRELRNTIERIILHWDEEEIMPKHLQFLFQDDFLKSSTEGSNMSIISDQFTLPEYGIDLNSHILDIVKKALEKNNDVKTKAAHFLGISLRTLYTYLKKIDK
jgi:DNA-binding NtrC family response regulator